MYLRRTVPTAPNRPVPSSRSADGSGVTAGAGATGSNVPLRLWPLSFISTAETDEPQTETDAL
jgi:hypothetical protein